MRFGTSGGAVAPVPRTADDVFVDVGGASLAGAARPSAAAAAAALAGLPWADAVAVVASTRDVPATPLLDVVATVQGLRGLNRFDVEQALGPRLEPALAGRYLVRTPQGRAPGDPDLTFRVTLTPEAVTGALRLPRVPAHRRPWKLEAGPGTLHPPMAAVLARLADPRPGDRVLDPFCGDGTVVVETALAAPAAHVHGSDLDPDRVAGAGRNAARAGVRAEFAVADAGRLPAAQRYDVVVTNPPWNLAVDGRGSLARTLDRFWCAVPGLLAPAGRLVVVADVSLEVRLALSRSGLTETLAARTRLAGRVADVVVAGPESAPAPLDAGLAGWRSAALGEGIVTQTGF